MEYNILRLLCCNYPVCNSKHAWQKYLSLELHYFQRLLEDPLELSAVVDPESKHYLHQHRPQLKKGLQYLTIPMDTLSCACCLLY